MSNLSNPIYYTAYGLHEGVWTPLPQYLDLTEYGVKGMVLAAAQEEGYKGSVDDRLNELGWKIWPVRLLGKPPSKSASVGASEAAPSEEPDWQYCIAQAEEATGLKVERHTISIVIREVRRWIAAREEAQVKASVLDALQHRETIKHHRHQRDTLRAMMQDALYYLDLIDLHDLDGLGGAEEPLPSGMTLPKLRSRLQDALVAIEQEQAREAARG